LFYFFYQLFFTARGQPSPSQNTVESKPPDKENTFRPQSNTEEELLGQRGVKRERLRKSYKNLDDGASRRGDFWPQISALFSNRSRDGRSFHFTLGVYNDTSVVLKVQKHTVLSSPWLALADNDRGVDLLAKLGLSLLASSHDEVAGRGSGQSVLSTLDTAHGDDHKRLGASVVGAVKHGGNGQTCKINVKRVE
jgi:hypothetical protein